MARFYHLTITPTLFGDMSVTRHWGRIGAKGRTIERVFVVHSDAQDYARRIISAKLKRGYVLLPSMPIGVQRVLLQTLNLNAAQTIAGRNYAVSAANCCSMDNTMDALEAPCCSSII